MHNAAGLQLEPDFEQHELELSVDAVEFEFAYVDDVVLDRKLVYLVSDVQDAAVNVGNAAVENVVVGVANARRDVGRQNVDVESAVGTRERIVIAVVVEIVVVVVDHCGLANADRLGRYVRLHSVRMGPYARAPSNARIELTACVR